MTMELGSSPASVFGARLSEHETIATRVRALARLALRRLKKAENPVDRGRFSGGKGYPYENSPQVNSLRTCMSANPRSQTIRKNDRIGSRKEVAFKPPTHLNTGHDALSGDGAVVAVPQLLCGPRSLRPQPHSPRWAEGSQENGRPPCAEHDDSSTL